MFLTAAICSANRPDELRRSLRALLAQERKPDDILVVSQATDTQTRLVAQELGVRSVLVDRPGLALAVETGINAAKDGVVAFVDDDAVAREDWLARIENCFESMPRLGALGGRDNVDGDSASGSSDLTVGAVRLNGRIVGNHHRGQGAFRATSTVKGANMALRTSAAAHLPLSRLVLGTGAQYRNELVLTALIRRRGWLVGYDPQIQVDHYPASRALGDNRDLFTPQRVQLNVSNELTALLIDARCLTTVLYLIRTAFVGTRLHPGLIQMLFVGAFKRDPRVVQRTIGTWRALAKVGTRRRQIRLVLEERD